MKLDEFVNKVSDGREFSVTFIKRTTGEERRMVCKRGVTEGVKGIGLKFVPDEKGLFNVYDVEKEAHRMVDLRNLISLDLDGVNFVWNSNLNEFTEA